MTKNTHPTFSTGRAHAFAYEAMAHIPEHPYVKRSYESLAVAIVGQWNGLLTAGFTFTASKGDPYANSAEMLSDAVVRRLRVFTDGGATLPTGHPMAARTASYGAIPVEGFTVLNDMFRAVHDIMGHAASGSGFGPVGEYTAWQTHYATLPHESRLALWCETRGQNAWTNFYADHQNMPIAQRPYAVQKCGIPGDVDVIHPVGAWRK